MDNPDSVHSLRVCFRPTPEPASLLSLGVGDAALIRRT
jgi:hypothetical protein